MKIEEESLRDTLIRLSPPLHTVRSPASDTPSATVGRGGLRRPDGLATGTSTTRADPDDAVARHRKRRQASRGRHHC